MLRFRNVTLEPSSGDFRRLLSLLFTFAISVTLCVSALGQSTTEGAIGGTVYDVAGAVVPNASVVVHNNGTNAEQRVTTDASGYFRVRQLQPATYTVTVTSQGFAPYKAENVIVQVGSLTDVSPRLGVAGSAETVSVTAETPQINTTSADFAPIVDQTQISNLPINGGRWSNFALLTPGVVNNSSGFGLISVRGISTLLNNNTVDGADNNQAFFSEERGRTRAGYSSPKVAVQEFQINTSNYSSEYGRAAGAVINTVTKSGTNSFHGELYFYDRDNDWGAKNPFTKVTTQTSPGVFTQSVIKPKDWRKMWGLGVGGPIIKDKLFFFFTYDQYRRNFPGLGTLTSPAQFFETPSPTQPAGQTPAQCASTSGNTNSNSTRNVCTIANNLNIPYATALTNYNNGLNDFLGELGPVPRTGDQTIFLPKIDWNITERNHASFEVNRMRWASPQGIQTQASNTLGVASFGSDYVRDTWGIAKLSTFVTNTIANEARYQYGRDFEFEFPQPPTAYEQAHLTNTGTYTNPFGITPDVFFSFNTFDLGTQTFLTRPKFPDEKRQQFADTVTWSHGNHSVKFGGDYLHTNDVSQNLRTQFGTYTYTTFGNYLSDVLSPGKRYSNFTQAFGPLGFEFNTDEVGFFGQDDWKIFPRLTLNLGLRWDYEMLPSPFSALVNPAIPQTGKLPDDKNNFAPRVGFALDLRGNGKQVLRGGYGIFYGRIINSTIYNALINTGMPGGQASYSFSATTAGAPTFPQVIPPPANNSSVLPGAVAAKPAVQFFDGNFQAPQIHETDLTFQQDLGWNTVMSVSYLGSYGRQLPGFVDSNIARAGTPFLNSTGQTVNPPATITYTVSGGPLAGQTITSPLYTSRINNNFGAMTDIFSGINSNYQALAVQLNHRLSHSLQFSANYTWAHALDFVQNEATFTDTNDLLDPYNLKGEYGNSIYNVPSRFVFNAVIDSPWKADGWKGYLINGWELAPLFQVQSGLPYSLTTSGNAPVAAPTTLFAGGAGLNGSNGRKGIPGLERNTFHLRNTQVMDLRLSKKVTFRERYAAEFIGEAFNLFNHFNPTNQNTLGYAVGGTAAAPTLTSNSTFGQVTNANSNFAYTPRQVQLAVRVTF
ncbi:MAG TPA: carboxypeptidase regulatory-like domain-containing protein [Terriglobales bacterium]|nr:carboxypeptidase regulatory-like domain-containing protein [Terriglobales bacterium]